MAVPSSGPIELRGDIALEVDGAATGTNVSLRALSNTAGFSMPDAMSEFRNYSSDLGLSAPLSMVSSLETSTLRFGQYDNSSYENIVVDLGAYIGRTVKLVWHYVSGTSFTGDVQIDNIGLININGLPGTYYSFGGPNTHSFETSTTDTSVYNSVSFSALAVGTAALRWNVDSGGTPSGSTGLSVDANGSASGYYVYAETSSPGYSNKNFWLRSPNIAITSSYHDVIFDMARYGAQIGSIQFYVDVIS